MKNFCFYRIERFVCNYSFVNNYCTLHKTHTWLRLYWETQKTSTVSEFNEFEPWLKSSKYRVQLSAGLNLEKINTILSGTNHI